MADNKETINCPACGKEMVKIYMDEAGVNLDVCLNGCGGIYFDNRELEKFDEKHEDISSLVEAYRNKTFTVEDETQVRRCPLCSMAMVKHYTSAKHEIQVDECYQCGGKFLDYQELDKIRAEYDTEKERADDVITSLYEASGGDIEEQNKKYEYMKKHPRAISRSIIYRLLVKNRK